MTNKLTISHHFPLQKLNTFGIDAYASHFLRIDEISQLVALREDSGLRSLPRLIIGGGSNLVLPDQLDALVLQMNLQGKQVCSSDADYYYVRAAAGESWHGLVMWTLEQGMSGLENLSLIPGTVGAAPIQNIGAYGVELQDIFHELQAFDFETGDILTLTKDDCRFAYRDSVFKQEFKDRMAILSVTLALPRVWQPKLAYADVARYLDQHGIAAPLAKDVSDAIMAIRRAKLPDPDVIGNAGSFFKNPLVTSEFRDRLLQHYPALVSYQQASGMVKLAAGWLIEQSGWKGKRLGSAGVYEKQALVLVNHGHASGADIRALAQAVQADVRAKFGVELEPEPVFA
jgi:UDP-N-acetylmuramate dehydrogenase